MATTIDTKVVEMKFKNDDFEKGAAETTKTINELNESLNLQQAADNCNKSLESISNSANSIDLSGITSATESINKKLSTLGVATSAVLTDMTTTAVSKVKTLYNNSIGQIFTGGSARAQKIASGNFKLKGVIKDSKTLNQAIESIGTSVKGTAYGLDAAYTIGSQLVASGIDAGSELQNTLTAAAGVASMTGTSFEYVGGLFAEVQAAGKVSGDVLTRLSEQGLAARQVLADAMGTTTDQISTMASNGEISSEKFFSVMYKQYGKFAKSANETYSGALANFNAALSRLSADSYMTYYSCMKDVLNVTTTFVDLVKKALTEVGLYKFIDKQLKKSKKLYVDFMDGVINSITTTNKKGETVFNSTFKEFLKGVENLKTSLATLSKYIKNILNLGYNNGILSPFDGLSLKSVLEEFVSFTKSMMTTHETALAVRRVIGSLYAVIKMLFNAAGGLATVLIKIGEVLGSILLPIFNTALVVIGAFSRLIYECIKIVNNFIGSIDFSPLAEVADSVEEFTSPLQDLPKIVNTALKPCLHFVKSLTKVQKIPEIKSAIEGVNQAIRDFANTIQTIRSGGIDALTRLFGDAGFDITPVTNGIKKAADIIKGFIDTVVNMATSYDGSMTSLNDSTTNTFSTISTIFESVKNGITNIVNTLMKIGGIALDVLNGLLSSIFQVRMPSLDFSNIFDSISSISLGPLSMIAQVFENITSSISGFLDGIFNVQTAYADTAESVENTTEQVVDKVTSPFEKVADFFKNLATTIHDIFANLFSGVKLSDILQIMNIGTNIGLLSVLNNLTKSGSPLSSLQDLKDQLLGIVDSVMNFPNKVKDTINGLKESLNSLKEVSNVKMLIIIAASLFALSIALEKLAGIPADDVKNALASLSTILLLLVSATYAMGNIEFTSDPKALASSALVLLAMSGSILMITQALETIAKLEPEQAAQGIIIIAGLAGIIWALAKGLSKVQFTQFAGLGVLLLTLGVTMKIIASAANDLVTVNWESIGKLGAIFAGMMLGVGVFIGVLSKFLYVEKGLAKQGPSFCKISKGINFVGIGLAFIGIAAGLYIIAQAVAALAYVPIDNMAVAADALSSIIGTIMVLMLVIGAISGELGPAASVGMLSAAAGILAIAVAMGVLVPAIALLAALDPNALAQGMQALQTILASIVIALGVLSLVGPGALLAGAGLMAFAVGLGAVIPLLMALNSIDMSVITDGLGKIIIISVALIPIMAALAVAGALALVAAVGFTALGIAIGIMAGALTIAAVGLLLLTAAGAGCATGIQIAAMAIGSAIQTIATSVALAIVNFIQVITENAPEIVNNLVETLSTVLDGLTTLIPKLGKVLRKIIKEGLKTIDECAPEAVKTVLNFLKELVEQLDFEEIIGTLTTKFGELLTALGDHLPELAQDFIDFVGKIFDAICDAIDDSSIDDIVKAFGDAFSKIFTTVGDAIKGILDGIGGIFDSVANMFWSIKDLVEVLSAQDFLTAANNAGKLATIGLAVSDMAVQMQGKDEIIRNTGEGIKNLADGMASLQDKGSTTSTTLKSCSTALNKFVKSCGNMGSVPQEINDVANALGSGIIDNAWNTKSAFQELAGATDTLTSSIHELSYNTWDANNNLNNLSSSANNISIGTVDTSSYTNSYSTIVSGAEDAASKMGDAGDKCGNNFVDRINDHAAAAKSAGAGISAQAKAGVQENNSGFYGLGTDAAQGYINGISSKNSDAYSAGSKLASSAHKGTKDTQNSDSPAKEFIKLGNYAGEGYTIGIDDYTSAAAKSGSNLARTAMDKMSKTLSAISDMMDENDEYSPTITPIVDLSNLDSLSSIASKMNGTFGVSGGRSVQLANAVNATVAQNGTNNLDIVSAINKLRSDLASTPRTTTVNNINGVTYDDGTNIASAIGALVNGIEMQTRAGVR